MTPSTQVSLDRIFYSGEFAFTGAKDIVRDIAFLVDHEYIALRTVTMGTKKQYLAHLQNVSRKKSGDEAVGGSAEHVALKLLAQDYLREIQGAKVLFEQPWCGYYPDVMTDDHACIIECGHTQNPEKILAYLTREDTSACIQVPYPDVEEKVICGYEFKPKKELNEFLEFLESERRADIRAILNRKRV